MDFDEQDEILMTLVSRQIRDLVSSVCDTLIEIGGSTAIVKAEAVSEMEPETLQRLLDILESTIGSLYHSIIGSHWKKEKVDEMRELGLVYIWVEYQSQIIAFMSIKLVLDFGTKELYLYEIHVDPQYQKHGIGTKLIRNFHTLAETLHLASDKILHCEATGLTVFSANEKALKWYQSLSYGFNRNSPREKILRNKVVKPQYYIMTRYIH